MCIYMDWWWMGRSIETYTDGWIDAPNTICVDVLWRLLQCGKTNQIPLVWKWEVYVHLGAMGFLWGIELELHGIMCAKSQACKKHIRVSHIWWLFQPQANLWRPHNCDGKFDPNGSLANNCLAVKPPAAGHVLQGNFC